MLIEPLVTIVIATYNDAVHLRSTLQSIREQSNIDSPELEVVVVDGESLDDTADVVGEFGCIVTTFVSERDAGVYDAMNKGAALARGRWLHFLNAGDQFENARALGTLFDAIRGQSGHAWVVSGALHLGGGVRPPVAVRNIPHVWVRHALGLQPHCHQACWFDRATFLAAGGHDLEADFVADFDYILRVGLVSPPLLVEQRLIKYQGGGISHLRRKEIPRRLHDVRCKRFQLSGPAAATDWALTKGLTGYLTIKRLVGEIRSSPSNIASRR